VCYDISTGWSRGKDSSVKSSFSWKATSTANNQKDSSLSQRDLCPNERIMEYELPKSEGYNHFQNKLDTQNPLAKVELVADDSTYLFFKSKIDIYTKKFKEYFPLSYEEI
jgi:hypothetical protein